MAMTSRSANVQKRGASGASGAAAPKSAPLMSEVGSSGLRRWGGIVDEEFLKELRGQRAIKTYREMRDNDDIIGAILFAFENLAKQVEWRIDPGGADGEADERAEFIRECLFEDMSHSWQETLSEILTFLVYGWSWMEIVYKVRGGDVSDPHKASKFNDGRIGWRKWALRGQDTLFQWSFDENGGIQALQQQAPPDYQMRTIPISKSLLFRTSTNKNNPEGRSLLRNAYRSWYFKKNMQVLEGIGAERDLAGYPYLKIDKECPVDIWNPADEAAATLKSSLERIVRSIRRDEQEGAILPWWCTLSLLSAPSRRQFDTGGIITRYDQRIAMTMLADFILLGHEAVGSKALSVSKVDLFCAAMGGFLDAISAVINKHAIPKLLRLNGLPLDDSPMLVHGKVERVDLAQLGDFLQKLSAAGAAIFPNEELERHALTVAGMPVPSEEGGTVGDEEDPPDAIDPTDPPTPPKDDGTQPPAGGGGKGAKGDVENGKTRRSGKPGAAAGAGGATRAEGQRAQQSAKRAKKRAR
jgi:hypothetical protein